MFRVKSLPVFAIVMVALAACGGAPKPDTKTSASAYIAAPKGDWRSQTQAMCVREMRPARFNAVEAMAPINGAGACGTAKPFAMSASLDGSVGLSPSATLRCSMVGATDEWIRTVVQPAAKKYFGEQVVDMRVAASYACRTRNHKKGAKLSEHGYANAIDISAFTFADGRTVTLIDGWNGSRKERKFLRAVHEGACGIFSTVIGPDGDRYHLNHFHFDLARHGRKGDYTYCR